ncbi:hypothetical protein HAT93_00898 [Dickeya solani]|nr:hypothetical protein [Dickeya solani]
MTGSRTTWLRHLAIAVGLVLFVSVQQAAEAAKIKNIVLVHGAFADGSNWSSVTAKLQGMGYQVTAVQNPLTSLTDDVEATERVLQRQQGMCCWWGIPGREPWLPRLGIRQKFVE